MVARLGAAPSVSSSQARRIAVFLRGGGRDKGGWWVGEKRADTLCRSKNGGLCGLCSRRGGGREKRGLVDGQADLPLDRRLLFVAELTGQGWWVVSVTLRRWSGWTSALQAARDLYAATNPKVIAGRGMLRAAAQTLMVAERSPHGRPSVNRTTMRKLMRLPRFSTFPQNEWIKLVDRHGFAPCFAAPAAMQRALRGAGCAFAPAFPLARRVTS
jgi:hypothetical protein